MDRLEVNGTNGREGGGGAEDEEEEDDEEEVGVTEGEDEVDETGAGGAVEDAESNAI